MSERDQLRRLWITALAMVFGALLSLPLGILYYEIVERLQ